MQAFFLLLLLSLSRKQTLMTTKSVTQIKEHGQGKQRETNIRSHVVSNMQEVPDQLRGRKIKANHRQLAGITPHKSKHIKYTKHNNKQLDLCVKRITFLSLSLLWLQIYVNTLNCYVNEIDAWVFLSFVLYFTLCQQGSADPIAKSMSIVHELIHLPLWRWWSEWHIERSYWRWNRMHVHDSLATVQCSSRVMWAIQCLFLDEEENSKQRKGNILEWVSELE